MIESNKSADNLFSNIVDNEIDDVLDNLDDELFGWIYRMNLETVSKKKKKLMEFSMGKT